MFIATPLPLCSTPTLYPTMGSWLLQTALTEAFPMHIGSMYTHTCYCYTLCAVYISNNAPVRLNWGTQRLRFQIQHQLMPLNLELNHFMQKKRDRCGRFKINRDYNTILRIECSSKSKSSLVAKICLMISVSLALRVVGGQVITLPSTCH